MKELANLAPEDAFRLALARSGYELAATTKRLGWTDSFMRRVLSSEKYFPSYEDIPTFCVVVGNTLVADWILARTQFPKVPPQEVTADYLKSQVLDLSNEFGHVVAKIKKAVSDNKITKHELRAMLREVLELQALACALTGTLREAEKRVARHD